MKLTQNEIAKFTEIGYSFKGVHDSLNELQKQLDLIKEKQLQELAKLTSIRQDEKEFFDNLTKKYGNGHLNLKTLTWNKDGNGN